MIKPGQQKHAQQELHRVAIYIGAQAPLLLRAEQGPAHDTLDLIRIQMTDFLIQDAQKKGIGLAAHRHRHIMGKRDIAVGHQIIKPPFQISCCAVTAFV